MITNPGRGRWESCQWIGDRQVFTGWSGFLHITTGKSQLSCNMSEKVTKKLKFQILGSCDKIQMTYFVRNNMCTFDTNRLVVPVSQKQLTGIGDTKIQMTSFCDQVTRYTCISLRPLCTFDANRLVVLVSQKHVTMIRDTRFLMTSFCDQVIRYTCICLEPLIICALLMQIGL